jgi:hypothetical protein
MSLWQSQTSVATFKRKGRQKGGWIYVYHTVDYFHKITVISLYAFHFSTRPNSYPNKNTFHVNKQATAPPAATAAHQTLNSNRLRLKCDGTREETRFRLSAKWKSPFNSAGASVQSTTGSWAVRISGSNAGYTMFRGSVKSIGYPPHSPVSPSLPLPCLTVCHHISTGLYLSLRSSYTSHVITAPSSLCQYFIFSDYRKEMIYVHVTSRFSWRLLRLADQTTGN